MSYHTFSDRHVITRKEHHCWGCCEKQPGGTKLKKNVCIEEGYGFCTAYYCPTCEAFMKSEHFDWQWNDDGLMQGDLATYDEYKPFKEEFLKRGHQ